MIDIIGEMVGEGIKFFSELVTKKEETKQRYFEEKRKEKEAEERTEELKIEKEAEKEKERQTTFQRGFEANEKIAVNAIDNTVDSIKNLSKDISETTKSAMNLGENSLNIGNEVFNNNKEVVMTAMNTIREMGDTSVKHLSNSHKKTLEIIEKEQPRLFSQLQEILINNEMEHTIKERLLFLLIQEKDKFYLFEDLRKEVENIQKKQFEFEKENHFYKGAINELIKSLERYQSEFIQQAQIIKTLKQENIKKRVEIETERLKDIEKNIIDIEFELLNMEKESLINKQILFKKEKEVLKYQENLTNYVEEINNKHQKGIEELLDYKSISNEKIKDNEIIDIDIEDKSSYLQIKD